MTIEPSIIEHIIETAPSWARAGLTAPNERLRRDAIATLAEHVALRLISPPPLRDAAQMALPL